MAGHLKEVARVFLPLGFTAFGGPAAHIAMLEEECVERRGWVGRQHFLDLVGATNLIPGPNSTEMVLHLGYERAGRPGLLVAGACFIGPAVALTAALGWLYVRYGALPDVEPWLTGIRPAVLAVIGFAMWRLGKRALVGRMQVLLGVAVAAAVLLGVGEIWALVAGTAAGGWLLHVRRRDSTDSAARLVPLLLLQTAGGSAAAAGTVSSWKLFFFFLKVGSVLYGSGYVLVAFLEGGLVQNLGWLTQSQVLDAVAIGQFTPGPVLSTATFIGWLVDGMGGAALATLGIFLPSFLFVLVLNPLVPKLRDSAWMSALLDAANVSSVALMAAVTVELAMASLTAWSAWILLALAAAGIVRYRISTPWIVLGAAVVGRLLVAARL